MTCPPPVAADGARLPRFVMVIALISQLSACAMPQPWVKPYERERLADPILQFSRNSLADKHREHVFEVREGAHGATGVQGGGCGCN